MKRKEGSKCKLWPDHIKEKHSWTDFEAMEDRVDLDCESLSSHSSEDNSLHSGGSFKQLLGRRYFKQSLQTYTG